MTSFVVMAGHDVCIVQPSWGVDGGAAATVGGHARVPQHGHIGSWVLSFVDFRTLGSASLGSALARSVISADIRSGCALAGLPNRHMVPTSAAAERRTSMHFGNLRNGCSRPTGCRGAAWSVFSRHQARASWWREPRAQPPAWPSCCFAPTAGLRASIPSQSPRSIQAEESRPPYWRRQRKSRGRANANPCGSKFTKEITVPLGYIVRPGIANSGRTVTITRTVAMRSGSRSSSRHSIFRKEPDHDGLGHRRRPA